MLASVMLLVWDFFSFHSYTHSKFFSHSNSHSNFFSHSYIHSHLSFFLFLGYILFIYFFVIIHPFIQFFFCGLGWCSVGRCNASCLGTTTTAQVIVLGRIGWS